MKSKFCYKMDPESEYLTLSPSHHMESPFRFSQEPDSEISPQKTPLKVFRQNANLFSNFSSECKKLSSEHHERVHSHSGQRPRDVEELSSNFRKILFQEAGSSVAKRSHSRDVPVRSNHWPIGAADLVKEKEIEHLNCKIKNLIKEKYELRNQIENQSKIIQQIRSRRPPRNKYDQVLSNKSQIESSMLEVTFKPKEYWDEPIQKHKRFPREVFRLPKGN